MDNEANEVVKSPELSIVQPSPEASALSFARNTLPVHSVPRSIFTLSAEHFERLKLLAQMCSGSQLTYAKDGSKSLTQGDIFLIMLKGIELGLEPMSALASIDLIKGNPTLDPQGMLALIYRSGQLENIAIESTDAYCKVMMKRFSKTEHQETFTMDDARRMMTTEWVDGVKRTIPLAEKHNWQQMPKIMLKWRCVAACCRVVFPDIIQGLYTPEELGADVDVLDDGTMLVVQKPAQPAQQQQPKPQSTVNQQQARKDLGGGDTRGPVGREPEQSTQQPATTTPESEPPAPKQPQWYIDNRSAFLDKLIEFTAAGTPDAVEAAALKLIGANDWSGYLTKKGADAVADVRKAWEAKQKPAQPKNGKKGTPLTDELIDDLETALWSWFDRDPVEVLEVLDIEDWNMLKTYEHAESEAKRVASENAWPVITTKVLYQQMGNPALVFSTAVGEVRGYGRTTKIKTMVGEGYYDANHFADMTVFTGTPKERDSAWIDIEPLKLTWDWNTPKDPTAQPYQNVIDAKPFIQTSAPDAPDDAAAESDSDVDLDDWLKDDVVIVPATDAVEEPEKV